MDISELKDIELRGVIKKLKEQAFDGTLTIRANTYSNYPKKFKNNKFQMSQKCLDQIRQELNNVNYPKEIKGGDKRIEFVYPKGLKVQLGNAMSREFGGKIRASGLFLIPPNGFFGWHTNADYPCPRVYFVYCSRDNGSFFYTSKGSNGKIKVKKDGGWKISSSRNYRGLVMKILGLAGIVLQKSDLTKVGQQQQA